MGAWSAASFGNDSALDWFGDLSESDDHYDFIRQTVNGEETDEIVAAGEVLAQLRGKPGTDVHPDVIEWCAGKVRPDVALLQAAQRAIQDILDDPDADVHGCWAELGENNEDYLARLATLRDIQSRLL